MKDKKLSQKANSSTPSDSGKKFDAVKISKSILTFITGILSISFVLVGTIGVVLYTQGYRFNFQEGTVKQTGVLSIESNPIRADIFVDGTKVGKTPDTVGNLEPGIHTVQVSYDGYITWTKNVEIIAEKSTPVYAHLFTKTPQQNEVMSLDDSIVNTITSSESQDIFVITERATSTIEKTYKIWKYNTKPPFWETNNPVLVFDADFSVDQTITVLPSPDGRYIVSEISDETGNHVKTLISDTRNSNLAGTELPNSIDTIAQGIFWNNNSVDLIIETSELLMSVSIPDFTQNVIGAKTEITGAWYTDETGDFYYIKEVLDEEELAEIKKNGPDGDSYDYTFSHYNLLRDTNTSTPDIVLEGIITNKTTVGLDKDDSNLQTTFKTTIESTRFVGKITDIYVNSEDRIAIITTDKATYLADLSTQVTNYPEFTLISIGKASQFKLAPDNEKLLYLNEDKDLYMFVYDKEEANHTITLGSHLVAELETVPQFIQWHKSSEAVLFENENEIWTADLDGDNLNSLIEYEGFAAIDTDGESVYILTTEENRSTLTHYKIRVPDNS